ncbi:MAG: hypothetical protein Q9197_002853 [Variospora fuerteventurae]
MLSSTCATGQDLTPQKLSKPRTNRSSSNLLAPTKQAPEPNSPLISSDADSTDGYFPRMAPKNAERKPRRNTRSKVRSYIYGQNQDAGQPHSSEDEESSPTSFVTVVKRRMSRTDSSTLLQTSSLGASAASSTSRLFLPGATASDFSVDDAMKEQIREKVWTDTLAAQNHMSSPVDEDKHPDSVMTPIRRRSLYTPGIATRSPEDILRKPPLPVTASSQAERDYYYNPALSESSPLLRLAELCASNNGRSTPSELDYTHLGTMKLGTLRVTNASPMPRDQNSSPVPISSLDTASQEDFHTASEGGRSDGGLRTGRSSQSEDMPRAQERGFIGTVSSSTQFPASTGEYSIQLEPSMEYCTAPSHSESYERYDIDNSESVTGHRMTANCRMIKRKPLPSAASRGHHQASSTAKGHASDLPGKPSPDAPEVHRALDGTMISRPEAVIDSRTFAIAKTQAMGPDVWRAFVHAAEQRHSENGSRDEALSKLTGSHRSEIELGDAQGLLQEGPLANGKDAHHVDSGYSSNISLDSTGSMPMSYVGSPDQEKPTVHLLEVSAQSQTGRNSYHQALGHGCDVPPSVLRSTHKVSDLPSHVRRERSSFSSERPSSYGNVPPKPLPIPEKSRKLQKRRPKSQPPPQRFPMSTVEDGAGHDIPPVPTAMRNLHFERTMKFPLLEHTYSSLEDTTTDALPLNPNSMVTEECFPPPNHDPEDPFTRDKPSLFQKLASKARSRSRSRPREKKILYESDEESIKSEICRSPSWSEYGNKRKKEQKIKAKAEREAQQRLRRESSADGNRGSRTKSRSRSRFRSRSTPRLSQHEPTPTLTDFGTVQESLGTGPYDIARSRPPVVCQPASKGVQPYQIGPAKLTMHGSNGQHKDEDEYNRPRSHSLAGLEVQAEVPDEEAPAVPYNVVTKPARPYSMFLDRAPAPLSSMADCRVSGQCNTNSMLTGRGESTRTFSSQAAPAVSMLDLRQPWNNAQHSRKSSPIRNVSHAPVNASSMPRIATMEELLDKLLDAPDTETKESILEQMRQQRRGLVSGLQRTSQPASGISADASRATGALQQSAPSGSLGPLRPSIIGAEKIPTTTATAVTGGQSHVFADAPPMPLVPKIEDIQQRESRRSLSNEEQSRTLTRPQVQAFEASKPDLWAGCAMKTEHKKASKPGADWDCHRLAWSQMRRSAGEALLLRNQPSDTEYNPYKVNSNDALPVLAPPRPAPRVKAADPEQKSVPPNDSKAFHKPWAARCGQQDMKSYSVGSIGLSQADSKVSATRHAFERLGGRFEGGLQYGYEPGFGLGGSAGTRSTKNGATRKSVHVSQGFGVDLSDVPIFVAPPK